MVFTSLDQTRLGQKEPLHALNAAKKLVVTDRPTDRQTDQPTDGHRHFKSSDGAKNERVMPLGTKEDGTYYSYSYIYSQAIIQSKLGVREFASLDNIENCFILCSHTYPPHARLISCMALIYPFLIFA